MSQVTEQFRRTALRQGIVLRTNRRTAVSQKVRYAAAIEMANYGFLIDPDALDGMSKAALTTMLDDARTVVGADRDMTPIYPGFPKQVEDLPTLTLLIEQIAHYITGGTLLPDYPDVVRDGLPLADMLRAARKVEVLNASETARNLIRSLTARGVALSEDERDLLSGAVALHRPSHEELTSVLRDAKNGENKQALLLALLDEKALDPNEAVILGADTAFNTDQLLRLVLAAAAKPRLTDDSGYDRAVKNLRDADAAAVNMNTLSRSARRALIRRLGQVTDGYKADRLVARTQLWRRVMRMVHPYTICKTDAERRALDIIHGNVEYRTLNSKVEAALAEGDALRAARLLGEHAPGNLFRRLVALMRLLRTQAEADELGAIVNRHALKSENLRITTLVSAYNGVIAANDTHARVTRAAGLNNAVVERTAASIPEGFIKSVSDELSFLICMALAVKEAPTGPVGIVGNAPVPLVRRDLATTVSAANRGDRIKLEGDGDVLRIFSHWTNTQDRPGYIDLGFALLDQDFQVLDVITWDAWLDNRGWGTYSGDKRVAPGDTAAEYFDLKMSKIKESYPNVAWGAMTLQSWSGFPVADVDLLAGVMHRSAPNSGEVFDPRSVVTAFSPTTSSMQSVPLAVDFANDEMIWLDSSSGSAQRGVSARNDYAIGTVVYDEVARPRMTLGELAGLWACAHDTETVDEPVDTEELLRLLD